MKTTKGKKTKYFDYNAPPLAERLGTRVGKLKQSWLGLRRFPNGGWYLWALPVILSGDNHEFFGRPRIQCNRETSGRIVLWVWNRAFTLRKGNDQHQVIR